GIDLGRFVPGDRLVARARLGLPADAFVVGIVATLRSWKGHRYLVEAVAGIPGAMLVMVGGCPGADNLRAQVKALGIQTPARIRGLAFRRVRDGRSHGEDSCGSRACWPTVTVLGPHPAVLVVVVARIGDTLLVTPALRALKQSSERLTVLVHPKRLEVLRNLSFIDDLGGITKNTAWLKALISPRYDMAGCYGRELVLFRYCARTADQVIAFDYPELRGLFGERVTRVPVPPESSMHAVDERSLLAEAAGVSVGDKRLAYVVTSDERDFAGRWLARHGRGGND